MEKPVLVAVSQHFASCCWMIDDLDSPLGFACVDMVLVESFQILPGGQIQFRFRKQVIESLFLFCAQKVSFNIHFEFLLTK